MERLIDSQHTTFFLAAKVESKSSIEYAEKNVILGYRNAHQDRAEVRASPDENSPYLLCFDAAKRPLE